MEKNWILILLYFLYISSDAQVDSIYFKPHKFILQLEAGINLSPYDIVYFKEENHLKKTAQFRTNYGLGGDFLISKNKINRSHLYFYSRIALLQNEIKYNYEDYYEGFGHFQPINSYSPSEFKFKYNALSISIGLSHFIYLKKLFLYQRIGFSYVTSLNDDDQKVNYDLTNSYSFPMSDSAHITATNPGGWYFVSHTSTFIRKSSSLYRICSISIIR